jgi:hypothetical protein
MLHEYGTLFGNTFHVVHVEGTQPESVKGQIKTWVFQLGKGWRKSNEDYRGFPFVAGFGSAVSVQTIAEQLLALAGRQLEANRFLEHEIYHTAPEIKYLTPSQREDLNQALIAHDLKISSYNDGQLELWRVYRP